MTNQKCVNWSKTLGRKKKTIIFPLPSKFVQCSLTSLCNDPISPITKGHPLKTKYSNYQTIKYAFSSENKNRFTRMHFIVVLCLMCTFSSSHFFLYSGLSGMSSDSRKSHNRKDPFQFLSFNTSLINNTMILKVLIPVPISILTF